MNDKAALLNEIRYAERLCLRTARLYRHVATTATFLSVLGGSGAISSLSRQVPDWVGLAGVAALAVFGAINLACRPSEKAAANEADAKRYAQLRTTAQTMTASELAVALQKARETDAAEVEALRDVAYNDVVREIGRPDAAVPLSALQRLVSSCA